VKKRAAEGIACTGLRKQRRNYWRRSRSIRAGRQVLEKIQYLSAWDRHRIETATRNRAAATAGFQLSAFGTTAQKNGSLKQPWPQPWRQPMLDAVDHALELGLPCFPCRNTGNEETDKSPFTKNGFKNASADPDVIREMFSPHPRLSHWRSDRRGVRDRCP
jgi:hypothetical protein